MIIPPLNSDVDNATDKLNQFPTLVDLLRYRALHQPEQIAYIFLEDGETESGSLTYKELELQAQAIAASLQLLVAPGERALLLYQSGLEFIAAFFGCLHAGVIAVPAYPPKRNQKMSRLLAIVADSQAEVALTSQDMLTKIESGFAENPELIALRWLATDTITREQAESWQEPALSEKTMAFLQYTSGSTGTPKGVMVSHGNIMHNSSAIYQYFGHNSNSHGVIWLPQYHDMGLIGGVLQPLYGGFPVTLMSPVDFLQKPIRWLQAISRYHATTSGGPNFAYDLCVRDVKPDQLAGLNLSSWELAFTGAEPVRAETIERFVARFEPHGFRRNAFYPCYGMAETTLIVSGGLKNENPVVESMDVISIRQNRAVVSKHEGSLQKLVGCGQSLFDQRILIVDPESLMSCADNHVGEIWVSGPSVTQGYWNKSEETKKTFHAFTADTNEGPFLRTGDLGFRHNGELFVTGRLKDVIIIRGRNHYPQDLEMTVEQSHPALRPNCGAAFSVEIDGEEKLVIAQEVERSYIRKLNTNEAIGAIRRAVSEQHELEVYAVVLLKTASLPKTSSGKVQRSACRAGFLAGNLDEVADWCASPQNKTQFRNLEAEVESLFQQVKNGGHRVDSKSSNSQELARSQQPSLETIQAWLIAKISEQIGYTQEIDIQQPLAQYGLNSLAAVSISGELQEWLGCRLSPTLLYDYPTIAALSKYLALMPGVSLVGTPTQANAQIPGEAIAIIGMGCRFPGAKDPFSFWQLLSNGVDAIKEVSPSRWDSSIFSEVQLDKMHTRWGGFLEQVDQFDPQFFGISPREAELMDPQQRLLLEVSWEALENAGQMPEQIAGSRTGVFIGISSNDYSQLQFNLSNGVDAYSATGNAFSIAANRLSYLLDLRGPSWAVDTACSSSLVAIHQACQSLRQGECHLALAGGVNLILNPRLTITFSKAGMIAVDGRCKTFDAKANGYVRGEGSGVVVLKRLSDALEDGDNIHAVIRGSAVTQDGRTNGLTAPSGLSQQAVIRQALENARVAPGQISYVEAHGTGTSLGDPIEVNSLKEVLMQDRSPEQSCWIGSVKTNIGHLEAAAGIAGLIKTVLALQHEEIPPHLHLKQINPLISLDGTPLAIPTERQAWSGKKRPRFAGISSFGFGGTNAHVVLEEAPSPVALKLEVDRPQHILTLSAKSDKVLRELAQNYRDFLATNSDVPLGNICFSANTGRSHFDRRVAIVTESTVDLCEQLEAFSSERQTAKLVAAKVDKTKLPQVAFLFTGQGSQYIGMGRQLYQTQPSFRQALDRCAEILNPYLDRPLLEVLYPESEESSLLDETAYSQPALFALEYALYQLWQSWGITPKIVMGYSLGEYVAACVAGVFSLEDGLKLVASRSRLMQKLPRDGEMVAVFSSQARVASAIKPYSQDVAIAAVNGPESVVISGRRQAVQAAIAILAGEGIKSKTLKVSHAFHSHLMEPMLADFERVATEVTYSTPKIELISNLTGQIITTEIAKPEYWIDHVRQSVRFATSLETIQQHGCEVFVEIGPKPTLLGMARHCLPEGSGVCLPSLRQGHSDWQQILQSLATLYSCGVKVDWSGFDRDYPRRRHPLPTYPFQRQRFWADRSEKESASVGCANSHPEKRTANGHPEEIGALLRQTAELLPKLLQVLNQYRQEPAITESIEDLLLEVKQPEPQTPWLLKALKENHPSERLAFLISHIQREVATVLHFDESQLPEPNLGFFDMGMDSILAVELKDRLETCLGHSISSTVAFNYPNIESLAGYLLSEAIGLDYLGKSERVFHQDDPNNLVAKVEHLSDAEAEALLVQKLAYL